MQVGLQVYMHSIHAGFLSREKDREIQSFYFWAQYLGRSGGRGKKYKVEGLAIGGRVVASANCLCAFRRHENFQCCSNHDFSEMLQSASICSDAVLQPGRWKLNFSRNARKTRHNTSQETCLPSPSRMKVSRDQNPAI